MFYGKECMYFGCKRLPRASERQKQDRRSDGMVFKCCIACLSSYQRTKQDVPGECYLAYPPMGKQLDATHLDGTPSKETLQETRASAKETVSDAQALCTKSYSPKIIHVHHPS